MSATVIINGTPVAPPEGAIAYKYNDPIEDARWIYEEDDLQAIAAEDPSLIVRPGAAPPTPRRLPLIGRERALVDGYAKKLRTTPLSQRGVRGRRGQSWETKRGAAWEVLLELDDKATGHVCRVEVTLDRLESSLVES